MNKPAMTAMRKQAQGGFTLIELIVVIVILGILAATALPKFASLGGDARAASLNAARGALASTAAMVHGQALIDTTRQNVNYEGVQIDIVNAYPKANNGTRLAAGLTDNDYVAITGPAAATANAPAVAANTLLIQPRSVATTTNGLTCNLLYAEAPNSNTPPTVTINIGNCGQ